MKMSRLACVCLITLAFAPMGYAQQTAASPTPEAAANMEATPAQDAATPALAQAPAATPAPAPAAAAAAPAGLTAPVAAAVGPLQPGKAMIVFFRPSKFAGSAIRYKVREGEKELGQLTNGIFFTVQVDPGEHVYTVHSEAKDITHLEVEAGQVYFLSGGVTMGFMAGRPNLSPSTEAAFGALLPKLRNITPPPAP